MLILFSCELFSQFHLPPEKAPQQVRWRQRKVLWMGLGQRQHSTEAGRRK